MLMQRQFPQQVVKARIAGPEDFEFSYLAAVNACCHEQMMSLICDPMGYYVVLRDMPSPTQNVNTLWWTPGTGNTLLYGSNNSIFHKLVAAGLAGFGFFYTPRAFALIYKKGRSFIPAFMGNVVQGLL